MQNAVPSRIHVTTESGSVSTIANNLVTKLPLALLELMGSLESVGVAGRWSNPLQIMSLSSCVVGILSRVIAFVVFIDTPNAVVIAACSLVASTSFSQIGN
ncbi:hypothetical protein Ae201684P_005842 [Aphanomyces euteiches]|nr:hypothetical protein Ae201684P_005842 [Aphanomyces euteiches]